LATRPAVFSPHFQYSVVAFPILFALTPVAIRRLESGRAREWLALSQRQLRVTVLGCVVVCSSLVSWKFGGLMDNERFQGGFARVARSLSEPQRQLYSQLRALVDAIPPGASLTVTNLVGAHASNRKEVYFYHQSRHTDYVLIDERDVKAEIRAWHQRRVRRGELELLGAAGESIKLYRFEPSKAVADQPASSDSVEPAAKPSGGARLKTVGSPRPSKPPPTAEPEDAASR
jgi:hypothetical protein